MPPVFGIMMAISAKVIAAAMQMSPVMIQASMPRPGAPPVAV